MKAIQSSISLDEYVGFVLVIEIPNDFEVATIWSVEKWRKALVVSLIYPIIQLLIIVPALFDSLSSLFNNYFFGLVDINFDEI